MSAASVENAVDSLLDWHNNLVTAIYDDRRIGMKNFCYTLYMYGIADRDIEIFGLHMVSVTPSSIIFNAVLIREGERLGTGAVGDVRDHGRFSYRLQGVPASIRDGRKCNGIGCCHA